MSEGLPTRAFEDTGLTTKTICATVCGDRSFSGCFNNPSWNCLRSSGIRHKAQLLDKPRKSLHPLQTDIIVRQIPLTDSSESHFQPHRSSSRRFTREPVIRTRTGEKLGSRVGDGLRWRFAMSHPTTHIARSLGSILHIKLCLHR